MTRGWCAKRASSKVSFTTIRSLCAVKNISQKDVTAGDCVCCTPKQDLNQSRSSSSRLTIVIGTANSVARSRVMSS